MWILHSEYNFSCQIECWNENVPWYNFQRCIIFTVNMIKVGSVAQMWRASSLFPLTQSCASRICSTRTYCKSALLHWHLCGEKCSGIYLKSGNMRLVSLSWQHTCPLCFKHEFLADDNVSVVPQHSLCSPDSLPSDFLIFPELKIALKGRKFHSATVLHGKL
jgi:hypothetical protein